jgi:hypothetical protein
LLILPLLFVLHQPIYQLHLEFLLQHKHAQYLLYPMVFRKNKNN